MANKAAWITAKRAQPLHVSDAPKPKAGPGEVVVKNAAVAINPIDWKIQVYGFLLEAFPSILGADFAGVVDEVGEGVTRLWKGQRVMGTVSGVEAGDREMAAFQLYTKAKELLVCPIPDDLSFERAVVLPLAITTASSALYSPENLGLPFPTLGCLPNKKVVLVWGGSSCCGSAAVQLATASGFTVLATASKHNLAYVRSLGAKMVFDYHDPHVVTALTDVVDRETLAGVFDAISTAESIEKWSKVLECAGGGRVAMTIPPPDELPKCIKATPVELLRMEQREQHICDAVWRNFVPAALVSGHLKAKPEPIVINGGLEMIQEGLCRLRQGVSAAKVVVKF
ncbi:zinc-binding oxidoreductase CipB [Macrophomina phaseolina]|uniref:Zinc-binding oxidoreductase CipB n=1 Tax=Macrophomina phaseolina TaxID=35725 RepID=A0ABQ8G9Q0_9PEZI|nr:zinc-binding oxidoreductase CipB [Macrophomina phaseolina]